MVYDILNAIDHPLRAQPLPLVARDLLEILFYPRSLTQYSRKKYQTVAVICLKHEQDRDYIRDVKIDVAHKAQMLARTRCPDTSFAALSKIFSFTGNKPLGDCLYTSLKFKRHQFLVGVWTFPKDWFAEYEHEQRMYWFRQSLWYYSQEYPLYLMEVFY